MSRWTMRATLSFLAICAVLLVGLASAEIPNEFKNLKVFPKDIGKRELVDAMRDYSGALGVRCTHCHVMRTPGDFDSIDWASDEIKDKETTRAMMRMVRSINGDLLPKSDHAEAQRVRCVTCHRGLSNPATLDRVLLATAEKEGSDAALAKYRELHEQYQGSGSYDFSPGTLHTVAETLAEGEDLEGAKALLTLNLEMHPKDAVSHLLIAQVQLEEGDTAGARASIETALELEPDNGYAQRMLGQLGDDS